MTCALARSRSRSRADAHTGTHALTHKHRTTSSSQDDDKPWKVWAGKEQVGQMAVWPSTNDVESILYNAIARKNNSNGEEKKKGLGGLFGFGR